VVTHHSCIFKSWLLWYNKRFWLYSQNNSILLKMLHPGLNPFHLTNMNANTSMDEAE
jgi:hypothetical protein